MAGTVLVGVLTVLARGKSGVSKGFNIASPENYVNRLFTNVYTIGGTRKNTTGTLGGDIYEAQRAIVDAANSDRNPFKPIGERLGGWVFKLFN